MYLTAKLYKIQYLHLFPFNCNTSTHLFWIESISFLRVSVSLFNGISTLFRLFNAKAILLEEPYRYYLTHSWEDKGVHTFPKGICPKVNVIAWLEFELGYYDSAVHRFNHYTTRTPLRVSDGISFQYCLMQDFKVSLSSKWGLFFSTILHKIPHDFSDGFKSGDFVGQSKTSIFFCFKRVFCEIRSVYDYVVLLKNGIIGV